MKNIIFQISGGIGKSIAATAVCRAIKKQYPEDNLIVITGYPEVFFNNPYVKKALNFHNLSYFYSDYIENKDIELMILDPYMTTDAVKEKKHLVEIWCDLYNIKFDGEKPELFFTKRELESYHNQIRSDRPIFLLQTNGGADNNKKYSWARDIPVYIALGVIEEFKNDYNILHVRKENQIALPNTTQLTAPFRQIAAISLLSSKRLVMDSFLQHTLAALNLPAVTCWIVNSPTVFGYKIHKHILKNPYTNEKDLPFAFLNKYNIIGEESEFPYFDEKEIFNLNEIIDALRKIDSSNKYNDNVVYNALDNKIKLPD
jgi:hypothetical protein